MAISAKEPRALCKYEGLILGFGLLTSLAEGCCPSGAAVTGRLGCGWLSDWEDWCFTEVTEHL